MLLRAPLARPVCLLPQSPPFVEAFFVLPMVVDRTSGEDFGLELDMDKISYLAKWGLIRISRRGRGEKGE